VDEIRRPPDRPHLRRPRQPHEPKPHPQRKRSNPARSGAVRA
jgi:hypothetical protein